jgi:hypothetical protein
MRSLQAEKRVQGSFMDAKAGSLPVTKETVGSSEISSINRSLSSCDAPSVTRMSNSACA